MRKLAVLGLVLSFVVLAGITTYAGKATTDPQLQSNAVCSDTSHPTERPKCDPNICPPVNPQTGCPRTDCDIPHGLCCWQCPGSQIKQCL